VVFNRSAEQRRAMFARMCSNRFSVKSVSSQFVSYSDFNTKMNKKFHEGIPSLSEVVFTDKNMEMKHPIYAMLFDVDRNHFSRDNKFAEAPTDAYKYNVINAVEGAIAEYDSNLSYFKKYGITKDDVIAIKVGKADALSKASSNVPVQDVSQNVQTQSVQGQSVQPIVQNTNAWMN
jgi:hypothetical protein